jgi:hypothetical protein
MNTLAYVWSLPATPIPSRVSVKRGIELILTVEPLSVMFASVSVFASLHLETLVSRTASVYYSAWEFNNVAACVYS